MSPIVADATSISDTAALQTSALRQRRDVRALSAQEMKVLTDAFTALKSSGQYDTFTKRHFDGMAVIHSRPWFLPWHRKFLLELENALRTIDSSLTVPYWKYEEGLAGGLFTDQGFGPNGNPANGYRVLTGPFANWHALIYDSSTGSLTRRSTPGLVRRIGQASSLPSPRNIAAILGTQYLYDTSPYNSSSKNSFRNLCEGFGTLGHNSVHNYVGGDITAATSPNDPVFFLIHSNVDRIWDARQRRYNLSIDYKGPAEQSLNTRMQYLLAPPPTPKNVMSTRDLGYEYV